MNKYILDDDYKENNKNLLDITPLIDQAKDNTEIKLLKNKVRKFSRKYKYFYNKIFKIELNNLINDAIKKVFTNLKSFNNKEKVEFIKDNIYTLNTNTIFNGIDKNYKKFIANHDQYHVSQGEILLISRMNIVPRTENISIQTHTIFPVMYCDIGFINTSGEIINIDSKYDKIIPLHIAIQGTFKNDFNI